MVFASQDLAVELAKENPVWKDLVVFGSLTPKEEVTAKNAHLLEKRSNAMTHSVAFGIIALVLVAVMRYEPSDKQVISTECKRFFVKTLTTLAFTYATILD